MHEFITNTTLAVGVRKAKTRGVDFHAITLGGKQLQGRSGPLTVQDAVVESHPDKSGVFVASIRDVRLIPAGSKNPYFKASGSTRIEAARRVVQKWRNAWEVMNARPKCIYGRENPGRRDHGTTVPATVRVRLVWAHWNGSGVSDSEQDMCEACLKVKRQEFSDPEEVAAGRVTVVKRYT